MEPKWEQPMEQHLDLGLEQLMEPDLGRQKERGWHQETVLVPEKEPRKGQQSQGRQKEQHLEPRKEQQSQGRQKEQHLGPGKEQLMEPDLGRQKEQQYFQEIELEPE
jgi:hypothetical protein